MTFGKKIDDAVRGHEREGGLPPTPRTGERDKREYTC
jgi:hypothetical protein